MGRESDSKEKKIYISQPYLFENNRSGFFVLLIQSAPNKRVMEFSVCRHSLNLNKHWFRAHTLMLERCSNEQICNLLVYNA